MLHAHYLMNRESNFARNQEKIFKLVVREPIRDIKNILSYENTEKQILSFNVNKVVEKKLFEFLTNDSCTIIQQA